MFDTPKRFDAKESYPIRLDLVRMEHEPEDGAIKLVRWGVAVSAKVEGRSHVIMEETPLIGLHESPEDALRSVASNLSSLGAFGI